MNIAARKEFFETTARGQARRRRLYFFLVDEVAPNVCCVTESDPAAGGFAFGCFGFFCSRLLL
jgi:hypothetical protein